MLFYAWEGAKLAAVLCSKRNKKDVKVLFGKNSCPGPDLVGQFGKLTFSMLNIIK